jgi:hypothetical protein
MGEQETGTTSEVRQGRTTERAMEFRLAARAGWWTALMLGPHLVIGTWLLAVPDHLAFRTAQAVTLLHVFGALAVLPFGIGWILLHARRMAGPVARATSLAPHTERDFEARLLLPPGAAPVVRVVAEMMQALDPEPIAVAEMPIV